MKTKILITLLLLSFSFTAVSQEAPQKPIFYPTGNEATLVGTISLKGALPKPLQIDMGADPACVKLNRKPEVESLKVDQGRLKNAFVYVKGEAIDAFRFELPDAEVTLQHRACNFEPHVLAVRAFQPLRLFNADPTIHNFHPTPKLNAEWNYSFAAGSPASTRTFDKAEILIPFRDNQHPWEKAYVAVMDHPFFAITDSLGKFEIKGLPAGTYKLVVWHEMFDEQELEVTVVPGEIRNADFTFDIEKVAHGKKYWWP